MKVATVIRRRQLAVVIVCGLAPSIAAWMYIHVPSTAAVKQIIYFATKVLLFSCPIVWFWFVEKSCNSAKGLPQWTLRKDLIVGLTSGVIIGTAIVLSYFTVLRAMIDPVVLNARVEEFGAKENLIPLVLFLAIVNSGLEEYYWRWFVYGRSKQVLGHIPAVILSGIMFAAHHFVVLQDFLGSFSLALLLSVGIALGGMIWAQHFSRSRRLWGVWVSHILVDVAALGVGYHLLN